MNKLKQYFLISILILVISGICLAQNSPQDRAILAIRKARNCLYKCKDLSCLEEAIQDYNRIRRQNPNANLPPHNLANKLRKLKSKCSDSAVEKALRSGFVKGTTIKSLSGEDIANLLIVENSLRLDITLTKIELKQRKSQIKQLREQRKNLQFNSEDFKEIDVREKELQRESDALSEELIEKKKFYNENFGLKIKFVMWLYKVRVKLKIIKQ